MLFRLAGDLFKREIGRTWLQNTMQSLAFYPPSPSSSTMTTLTSATTTDYPQPSRAHSLQVSTTTPHDLDPSEVTARPQGAVNLPFRRGANVAETPTQARPSMSLPLPGEDDADHPHHHAHQHHISGSDPANPAGSSPTHLLTDSPIQHSSPLPLSLSASPSLPPQSSSKSSPPPSVLGLTPLTRPLNPTEQERLAHLDRLKFFLATAPSRWDAQGELISQASGALDGLGFDPQGAFVRSRFAFFWLIASSLRSSYDDPSSCAHQISFTYRRIRLMCTLEWFVSYYWHGYRARFGLSVRI
jgi:hypothetical protein